MASNSGLDTMMPWEVTQEEKDYESQIAEYESYLSSGRLSAEERQAYEDELKQLYNRVGNLKKSYQAEAIKQGITDQSGRLLSAKDVQNQYLDRGYLNLRQAQGAAQTGLAMSEAAKAKRAMQGTGTKMSSSLLAGNVEGAATRAQDAMAQDIRSGTLRAKSEAGSELARKQSYVSTMTELERADIKNKIDARLDQLQRDGKLSAEQVALAKEKKENLSDDGLTQFLGTLLSIAGTVIGGYFGPAGAAVGGAVGTALGGAISGKNNSGNK